LTTDLDVSKSKIYVKKCVIDDSQACFLLLSESGLIRITMSMSQFNESINHLAATLPTNCVGNDNIEINCGKLYETSVKVVDMRAGVLVSVGKKIPELRLYTGKKRKHYVRLVLSWSQMKQLVDAMKSMKPIEETVAA
jgi:hypothetical protein